MQINSLENDEDFMRTEKKSSELILENNRLVDIISELNIELDKIKTENRNTISQNIELNKSNKSYQHDIQKIQKLTTAFENLKKNNEEQSATIANLKTELTHYKKRVYDENSLFAIDNFNVNNEIESKYKQQIEALNLEVKNIKDSNKELLSENLLLKNEIKNINDNLQNEQNRNHLVPEQNKNQQQDSEKDEIINKLESFISKLEKKL
ncbi:hypothetical protein SDC9_101335 [bioreactor metagenome]|uniref:Uncharacterized protein n=1 Tax=bioreactor metagenome TaxID=1076179 RepID=A0A645AND7_9ZZZZ